MINFLLVIFVLAIIIILLFNIAIKAVATLSAVAIVAVASGFIAIHALVGNGFDVLNSGPQLFGDVPVRVDALSGWFILVINFTMLTGAVYGFYYMKRYRERRNDLTLHCISYLLLYFSLLGICIVENSFFFLLFWELMALAIFVLIIFDHHKPETIKAGINYLIHSHISIVLLTIGFVYFALKTNSYSFDSIRDFSASGSSLAGTALYICFFIGFAIKAGFVPFHTWLPYAHPAAPTHVSGIMSGVAIKIGIFGILRMLLLIKTDFTTVGYFILAISLFTGIYGVMLATIQHDLKKLLTYHSIENIGIIGIGIGLGCIGLGSGNKLMAILGFSGALLHTLNHSLFKSLLFYTTGNVLQAYKTVNIERLGGIIKKMPQTAILFLVAALAICGLPPLNGFISEFLIYNGLYHWLYSAGLVSLIATVFALTGLVLIGGLALLCFTKALSIVFLGSPRSEMPDEINETGFWQLLPLYIIVILIISIGLFPAFFISAINVPVNLLAHNTAFNLSLLHAGTVDSLRIISWSSLGFIALVLAIAAIRKNMNGRRAVEKGATWGCGYGEENSRAQYTASSYVRSFSKLAKPVLDIEKKEIEIKEAFPSEKHYETRPYDKIERVLIDNPLRLAGKLTDLFGFLQNGYLQRYILYGIIFITGVICLPLLWDKIISILHLLKTL